MRLVMTLLVRNEQDVLRANLEHHLAQGVDHVIITDNLSEDATRDITGEYERAGVATVIDESDDDYDQAAWVTRMARIAADELAADWVVNNDADEFWFAPDGTLAEHLAALPPAVTVVDAPRHDLLPQPEDDRPWYERLVYRHVEPLRFDGTDLPSKVCHRAAPDVKVGQGNHVVTAPTLDDPVDTGVRILHVPMRSEPQMRRKVILGGAAYQRNEKVGPRTGHLWRDLAERERRGSSRCGGRTRSSGCAADRAGAVGHGRRRPPLRDLAREAAAQERVTPCGPARPRRCARGSPGRAPATS